MMLFITIQPIVATLGIETFVRIKVQKMMNKFVKKKMYVNALKSPNSSIGFFAQVLEIPKRTMEATPNKIPKESMG